MIFVSKEYRNPEYTLSLSHTHTHTKTVRPKKWHNKNKLFFFRYKICMKREKTLRKGEEAVPSMRGKLGISEGLCLDKNTPDLRDFDSNDDVWSGD